ncbi:LOG family protein [Elioraea thermophila]|uniref:LOG family protein n=1 Tax=Elioraea thermophila TaxID=2185104 RepID=UPI0013008EED|nr:LOG family protein [Elioraea thermophila]
MQPSRIRAVAVFCGSRLGHDPRFVAAADRLGRLFGEAGVRLVYGGGRIGLMGRIADACLAAGGQVTGVIPRFLAEREVAHEGVADMRMVAPLRIRTANGRPPGQTGGQGDSRAAEGDERELEINAMHIRKAWMAEEADAFVMLPGGLGTLDETIEILTWRQLGLHDKPIVLCDVAGSARPLIAAIDAAIAAGFAEPSARALFAVAEGPDAVLPLLASLTAPSRAAAAAS